MLGMISFGLRAESFWGVMPIFLGFCLINAMEKNRKRWLWTGAMVLGAALLLTVVDGMLYRLCESGWGDFRTVYNLQRGLLDYNNTDVMEKIAVENLGWPEPLLRMVRNWYMLDSRMNAEQLSRLLEAVGETMPKPTLYSVLKAAGSILRRYPMFMWNFAAFGALGLWSCLRFGKEKQWGNIVRIAGIAVFLLGFLAYFYGIRGRLPERAAFVAACPAYALITLTCFPAIALQWKEKASCQWTRVAAAFTVLTLICGGATFGLQRAGQMRWIGQRGEEKSSYAISRQVYAYGNAHPELIYVTNVPRVFAPFAAGGEKAAVNVVDWGHCMFHSPMFQAKWETLKIEGLQTESLFDPSVRVILGSPDSFRGLMAYLESEYGAVTGNLEEEGAGFRVYRITRGAQ